MFVNQEKMNLSINCTLIPVCLALLLIPLLSHFIRSIMARTTLGAPKVARPTGRTGKGPPAARAPKQQGGKAPRRNLPGGKGGKAPRRRNNTRRKKMSAALREIREYQKSTELLIRKAPFSRLVREIARGKDTFSRAHLDFNVMDIRWQAAAILALQEAAESYLVRMFERSMLLVLHAKRVTLMQKDIALFRRLERN